VGGGIEDEVEPISFLTDDDEGPRVGWLVEGKVGRAVQLIIDQRCDKRKSSVRFESEGDEREKG